jgi:predicted metalloprotease
VIAGLSVLTLLLVTGGTFAGFKLIDSYDSVSSPMSRPTVRKSEAPIPVLPDPTVTVTATPVPDLVRLRQNKLYTAGKVPTVACKEPSIKPTSQSSVLKYYNALLPCLNRAWQPLVTKAGYEFRAPKIVLQSKQSTKPCERQNKDVTGYYCDTSEALSIPWQSVVKNHKSDPQGARTWMMTSFASLYGHHVQELTHILPATLSRQGWAKTEPEKLEWNRRRQLQAICLASAFLGANKEPLGLTGSRLELWEYQMKNSGDDNEPKEPRTHGSRKSNWLWTSAAFKSANPASCNTYTASATKVS